MKPAALLAVSLSLLVAVFFGGQLAVSNRSGSPAARFVHPGQPSLAVCFAPGTPPEYMAEWEARMENYGHLDYRLGGRWGRTANNNQTGSRGTPITLTYSFVPDGVTVDGQPNELFAMMNSAFGSPEVWQAKFAQIFADWGRVCGIQYVQVSDDGAAWPDTRGVLGSRGDVRIASAPIDGQWNVLALDYYPDYGDMLLDADEDWGDPAQNYIFFRNIARHEHGHGIGMAHVCPSNGTKLMEPYYSPSFDGPQHDDIRGAQRNYGDRYEDNDNTATATRLGIIARDTTYEPLGIDGTNDLDFYKFSIPSGKGFTLTVIPDGRTYLEGPQNGDGTCSSGTMINSLDDLNLDLQVYNASGVILLAESANHPAGEAERIFHYTVQAAGDSFVAKVKGTGTDEVQLYKLQFSLFNLSDPYLSVCPLEFDTMVQGSHATLTTRIVNPATAPINVYSVSVDSPFTVEPNGPQTIAAHDSLLLTVGYTAEQPGYHSGTLTVSHSSSGGPLVCQVSVTVVNSWLQFVLSRNVDFGDVPLGTTDSARVPVRAQGNIPLTIQSIEVAPPFSINVSLPLRLEAMQSVFLVPRFTPTELGPADGILLIYHTGTGSPDTMFLHGTCVPGAAGERPEGLPSAFRLAQNYPNPFNPTTRISFDLPHATQVTLRVYDVQGRLVREQAAGELEAGRHFLVFDGSGLSSGLYFYRVVSPDWTGTGKMMLLK
jgi:hypothetical protein